MMEEAERKKNQLNNESVIRRDMLLKTQKLQKISPGSKLEKVFPNPKSIIRFTSEIPRSNQKQPVKIYISCADHKS